MRRAAARTVPAGGRSSGARLSLTMCRGSAVAPVLRFSGPIGTVDRLSTRLPYAAAWGRHATGERVGGRGRRRMLVLNPATSETLAERARWFIIRRPRDRGGGRRSTPYRDGLALVGPGRSSRHNAWSDCRGKPGIFCIWSPRWALLSAAQSSADYKSDASLSVPTPVSGNS